MSLVLTSCTNRKRVPPPRALRACAVKPSSLDGVVGDWCARLASAEAAGVASDLYCGRAFRQAEATARSRRADFMVVSAGLGLVSADALVPSYSLTVVPGTPDNILDRIAGSVRPSEWWGAINESGVYGRSLERCFKSRRGPILVALSGSYLAMIAAELLALPEKTLERLRIFSLSSGSAVPEGLSRYRMPYDARFDGDGSPLPGTRGDFAQRALAHFAETVLDADGKGSLERHSKAVSRFMSKLPQPEPISRAKASDEEIVALIHRHWRSVDGRSGRMLRYLRDDLGVACEQSRFRDLFRAAKDARA